MITKYNKYSLYFNQQMINIWKLSVYQISVAYSNYSVKKRYFFLPDLRMSPIVEENCSADLSHRERWWSVSVSASIEETDVDVEIELQCSSETSLERPLWRSGELCGEFGHEEAPLAWLRSWFPFPSPSRWAWNVEICCSRDRKLSCTLSNCEEKEVFSPGGFLSI